MILISAYFYFLAPYENTPERYFTLINFSGLLHFTDISATRPAQQEDAMSMYFYDETDDWPEYVIAKDDIHRLENEYLESRKLLQETESALRSDPANENLKTRMDELKIKVKEIEKQLTGSTGLYR